jgi:uroporphyrinogen-III synthase
LVTRTKTTIWSSSSVRQGKQSGTNIDPALFTSRQEAAAMVGLIPANNATRTISIGKPAPTSASRLGLENSSAITQPARTTSVGARLPAPWMLN